MLYDNFRMSCFASLFLNYGKQHNVAFGKHIARLRKMQEISQEELAFRCSVHRTYIGALERGEKSPTLNTIQKLAKGLNMSLVELFKNI